MDPLQNDIWAHLGHVPDAPAPADAPMPPSPVTSNAAPEAFLVAAPAAAVPADQRQPQATRRRFDRGGRRRSDWPEDAGLSCCPGCGFEHLQSLGAIDSGDYLWQCPHCDRRFQTGRATRTML